MSDTRAVNPCESVRFLIVAGLMQSLRDVFAANGRSASRLRFGLNQSYGARALHFLYGNQRLPATGGECLATAKNDRLESFTTLTAT
jgi:hypothetical protein